MLKDYVQCVSVVIWIGVQVWQHPEEGAGVLSGFIHSSSSYLHSVSLSFLYSVLCPGSEQGLLHMHTSFLVWGLLWFQEKIKLLSWKIGSDGFSLALSKVKVHIVSLYSVPGVLTRTRSAVQHNSGWLNGEGNVGPALLWNCLRASCFGYDSKEFSGPERSKKKDKDTIFLGWEGPRWWLCVYHSSQLPNMITWKTRGGYSLQLCISELFFPVCFALLLLFSTLMQMVQPTTTIVETE